MASVLQAEVLTRLREEGGPELVHALASLLERSAPARLARLKQALTDGTPEVAIAAAHSLKSAAANLGAAPLAAAALAAERLARAGDWHSAAAEAALHAVERAWLDTAEPVRLLAAAAGTVKHAADA